MNLYAVSYKCYSWQGDDRAKQCWIIARSVESAITETKMHSKIQHGTKTPTILSVVKQAQTIDRVQR